MNKKNISVLIAEDDHLVCESIKGMLDDNNYNVIGEASNGEQAVYLANNLNPDVILMDIDMPKMNGIEATRIILKNNPVPIIALTAYNDNDLVIKASIAGISSYLIKPPDVETINRSIIVARERFYDMINLKKTNEKLKNILNSNDLEGLIPICAKCKDIRDKNGSWLSIENYLKTRSNLEFSHGLCPDCIKELYPQYYKEKLQKENN